MSEQPAAEVASTRSVRVAGLDGLRGLAALSVLVTHVSGRTDYAWLSSRSFGPMMLFTLSGFLLYMPWARAHLGERTQPSVRTFAVRRFFRIFPAYWLVLGLVAVALAASRPVDMVGWVEALGLAQIYDSQGLRPSMEQVWSLGTEISFYLALPLVAAALAGRRSVRRDPERQARREVLLLLATIPATYAFRVFTHAADLDRTFTVTFWLPAFASSFAVGMALSVLAVRVSQVPSAAPRLRALANDDLAVLMAALAVFLISASAVAGPASYGPTTFAERQVRLTCAMAIAALLILPLALGDGRGGWSRWLRTRGLDYLGRTSYGIYLWHLPVIALLVRNAAFPTGPAGLVWLLSLTLAISVPLAALTYHLVELPSISLSRRLTPSTPDVAVSVRDILLRRRRPSRAVAMPSQISGTSAAPAPSAMP